MVDGRTIARRYGYTKPTFVYIYYRLEKNEFLFFDRVFHKIIQNSNRIRREHERAEESDDDEVDDSDESEENPDADDEVDEVDPSKYKQFEIYVSNSLANTKQVFVSIFYIVS
jgi:hypothetical protein